MKKSVSYKKLREQFNQYRDHQDYTPGILILKNWIKQNPDNKDALAMLAELLDKRGLQHNRRTDLKESEKGYDNLIKMFPTYHGGYFGKIRFLLRRDDKQACAIAKKYLKISRDQSYNMYIGHCYKHFNDLRRAEKYYLNGYKYIKNHYGPDYALAVLYVQMGDFRMAKKYAKRGIQKFKKMPTEYRKSTLTKNYISELKQMIHPKKGG